MLTIAAVGLLACTGKNTPEDPNNSKNLSDSVSISCNPDTLIVGISGGRFSVTLSSKSEWSATANKEWVTISPDSGLGDSIVTIVVTSGDKDEACVLFNNGDSTKLVIYREDISCDPTVKEVNINGEEFTVTLETHDSWSATSNKPWVIVTPESGRGNASVNICVSRGSDDEALVIFNCNASSDTLTISSKVQYKGGLLPGKFSISTSKQIQFSQGNLQYQANTQTWWFAVHQYDMVGSGNSNIGKDYSGWIDLFGWGTGNNPTNSSTNNSDYSKFVDWGSNIISNGGNEAGQWRTLKKNEWTYLFFSRANSEKLFGLGSVNNVSGVIILPDNWSSPNGLLFTPSTTKGLEDRGGYYSDENTGHNHFVLANQYNEEQWAIMEASGAVFLPAAGHRTGTDVHGVGSLGYYWSPNTFNLMEYSLGFSSNGLDPQIGSQNYSGHSVRLVR